MRRVRDGALAAAVVAGVSIAVIHWTAPPTADLNSAAARSVTESGASGTTTPPAPRVRPAGSGPLGLKWNWAQLPTLDFVESASGGWTFSEVEWCDVETSPGSYDWTTVDRIVREARALGHETMLKLRTGQCWSTEPPSNAARDTTENVDKQPSTPTTDLPSYLDFVRATVTRYAARGIDDYAIENEPDTVNHWAASLSEYRRLAVQVAGAIREAHPGAHVLDGGTSSTSYGVAMAAAQIRSDPRQALRTYRGYYARRIDGGASRWPAVKDVADLRALLKSSAARRSARAVDIGIRLANSGVADGYQLHYYEPTAQLPELLRFLDRRLDDGVPLEAWEIGVAWPGSGYDERAHADEVFRLVARLLGADIRRVVYLPVAYTDAPGKVQVFRGLTTPSGSMLPAGGGWQALAPTLARLRGAAMDEANGRLRGVTWTIGRHQTALVWARKGTVRLDPSDVSQVLDATGAIRSGAPIVGRRPVLVIGSVNGKLARRVSQGVY